MTQKVKDIGAEEYRAWRHHPVSKMFLRYVQDYRAALLSELLRCWEADKLTLSDERAIRGRVEILDEIATVEFESIAKFYEQSEAGNAAQATQDRTE